MSGKRGPYNTKQGEYILDEYAWLHSFGLSVEDIAPRLGVQAESLRQTLRRAARNGDPRSDWEPHTHVPSGTYDDLKTRRERARGWVA